MRVLLRGVGACGVYNCKIAKKKGAVCAHGSCVAICSCLSCCLDLDLDRPLGLFGVAATASCESKSPGEIFAFAHANFHILEVSIISKAQCSVLSL